MSEYPYKNALIQVFNVLNEYKRDGITHGELLYQIVNADHIIAKALRLSYPLPDKLKEVVYFVAANKQDE